MLAIRTSFLLVVLLATVCGRAESAAPLATKPRVDDQFGWWPTQAMPKAIVRASVQNELPARRASCEMMVQSLAGLAAKAVNDHRGDEMVWVATDNVDVEDWLARLLKRHPQLDMRGVFDPWPLVDRYLKQGIIK